MGEERNSGNSRSIECSLPKLLHLKLRNLSELKSICSGVLICDALQEPEAVYCMKLERCRSPLARLKMAYHLLEESMYPKEWWESVELDQPNAKNTL